MTGAKHRTFCYIFFSLFIMVTASEASTVTYTDRLGRTVDIQVPVRRSVFLTAYELIPALGLWDRVAGISRWAAYKNDMVRATMPDRKIPVVGSTQDVNIEVLLKLKPDLVITWTFRPEVVSFMEGKGLRVIAIYPESISELYDVMRLHGRLFEREAVTEQVIDEMESLIDLIRLRVRGIDGSGRRKVLWLWSKPTQVAGGIGIQNDLISLINAVNPAGDIPSKNPDVSLEQILVWNPDVIFIWGNTRYSAADILGNTQWRFVRAVREGRVYKAPGWSTWSPRLAPVALWMAMKTYPAYFRGVDMDRIVDDFYREVFGVPYSKGKAVEK